PASPYRFRPHPALPSFPTRRSSDLPASGTWTVWSGQATAARGSLLAVRSVDRGKVVVLSGSPRKRPIRGRQAGGWPYHDFRIARSEEHTSELQSLTNLVCRLLLYKK